MGHLVNPIAYRIGWSLEWIDHWYGLSFKGHYSSFLHMILRLKIYLTGYLRAKVLEKTSFFCSHFDILKCYKGLFVRVYFYHGSTLSYLQSLFMDHREVVKDLSYFYNYRFNYKNWQSYYQTFYMAFLIYVCFKLTIFWSLKKELKFENKIHKIQNELSISNTKNAYDLIGRLKREGNYNYKYPIPLRSRDTIGLNFKTRSKNLFEFLPDYIENPEKEDILELEKSNEKLEKKKMKTLVQAMRWGDDYINNLYSLDFFFLRGSHLLKLILDLRNLDSDRVLKSFSKKSKNRLEVKIFLLFFHVYLNCYKMSKYAKKKRIYTYYHQFVINIFWLKYFNFYFNCMRFNLQKACIALCPHYPVYFTFIKITNRM